MTNHARGDIAISIGGQDYRIRPTFQALCEIEAATGKPVLVLAEQLAEGVVSLSDIATVIAAGIRAGSHVEMDNMAVGEEMLRVGVAAFLATVSGFFRIALTGNVGKTKKKPASSPGIGTLVCS